MSTTSTWSRIATPIVIGSAILYGVHKAGLLPFNKPPTTTQITPTTPTTPSPCSQSSSTSSPSSYIGQSSHWTNLCQNLDTIKQVPIQDLIVDIHSISQSLSAKHKQDLNGAHFRIAYASHTPLTTNRIEARDEPNHYTHSVIFHNVDVVSRDSTVSIEILNGENQVIGQLAVEIPGNSKEEDAKGLDDRRRLSANSSKVSNTVEHTLDIDGLDKTQLHLSLAVIARKIPYLNTGVIDTLVNELSVELDIHNQNPILQEAVIWVIKRLRTAFRVWIIETEQHIREGTQDRARIDGLRTEMPSDCLDDPKQLQECFIQLLHCQFTEAATEQQRSNDNDGYRFPKISGLQTGWLMINVLRRVLKEFCQPAQTRRMLMVMDEIPALRLDKDSADTSVDITEIIDDINASGSRLSLSGSKSAMSIESLSNSSVSGGDASNDPGVEMDLDTTVMIIPSDNWPQVPGFSDDSISGIASSLAKKELNNRSEVQRIVRWTAAVVVPIVLKDLKENGESQRVVEEGEAIVEQICQSLQRNQGTQEEQDKPVNSMEPEQQCTVIRKAITIIEESLLMQ